MPAISRFLGIVISMFDGDHPPPHFHARYGEHVAQFAIRTGELLRGRMPIRQQALIREWAALHEGELLENWRLIEAGVNPLPIAPLDLR